MSEWRKVAVVADVGTTVVEGWAGYQYQASSCLMLGHDPDSLYPAITEREQSLPHFLKPARTDISHTRYFTDVFVNLI